jgi:hypothetical protein
MYERDMEEQRPNEHKQRKKAYLPMIRKKIESGQGFIASIKHPHLIQLEGQIA